MSERIEAKVTHHFSVSADKVYAAWLDPQQVRQWLAAALKSGGLPGDMRRVEIDAREGGRFLFSDQRGETEARHWGTYLSLKPAAEIIFTWIVDESQETNPSIVSLILSPEKAGCVAVITHEMDKAWIDYVPKVEAGWTRMLVQIEKLLSES